MNKLVKIVAISVAVLSAATLTMCFAFKNKKSTSAVYVYTGDYFVIPKNCKHIALLGCTPQPKNYLQKHNNAFELLRHITLKDFLDIDYLKDSFKRTFVLCKDYHVDHLIVAYLPIYYIGMRPLLGDQFVSGCRIFLQNVVKEIPAIMQATANDVGYIGNTTLIIPPDYQLSRVPHEISGIDERIRYLIKQFPRLKNISESALQKITIINNTASQEDDKLIDYLKYEYLYEKPIAYDTCNTGKERFHADINKN